MVHHLLYQELPERKTRMNNKAELYYKISCDDYHVEPVSLVI